ncbi:hypothetical protein MKZ38_005963 [Zalerion maritima]|uniref:Uncharacterized protein n=1 Tax=Zalerion maritima TaxID=339359 RepID=A0AAD5RXG4_9PEZI|nr:hypothetical protein MKZ38_005963 [Zalerion maritima]
MADRVEQEEEKVERARSHGFGLDRMERMDTSVVQMLERGTLRQQLMCPLLALPELYRMGQSELGIY